MDHRVSVMIFFFIPSSCNEYLGCLNLYQRMLRLTEENSFHVDHHKVAYLTSENHKSWSVCDDILLHYLINQWMPWFSVYQRILKWSVHPCNPHKIRSTRTARLDMDGTGKVAQSSWMMDSVHPWVSPMEKSFHTFWWLCNLVLCPVLWLVGWYRSVCS